MSRNINLCHPRLQSLAEQMKKECAQQGLIIAIGETFRSVAEQDALYAIGRTTGGSKVTNAKGSSYSSMHQWGIAYDIYRNDGSGAYNDSDGFFKKVGSVGRALGLEWGGDWKSIVDRPHFQLPDWGSTPSKLKAQYGNFDQFKQTWAGGGNGQTVNNGSDSDSSTSTSSNWVGALQQEFNRQFNSGLKVDGIPGPKTLAAAPTLRKGAKGEITRLIQVQLSSVYLIGIGEAGADGDFGGGTEAAVMEFQKQKGLSIDGIVGKGTWKAFLGL